MGRGEVSRDWSLTPCIFKSILTGLLPLVPSKQFNFVQTQGVPVDIKRILSSPSGLVSLEDRTANNLEDLSRVVSVFRGAGLKIVFTAGTWDLLHDGHINYLKKGRELGDVLIVAVETDALTRSRKGPGRPIVPEKERLFTLSEQRCVDLVILQSSFEEFDQMLELVRPDSLLLSSSTKDRDEARVKQFKEFCTEVVILPPQSSNSTTARIRKTMIDGGKELLDQLMVVLPQALKDAYQNTFGIPADPGREKS